MSEPTTAAGRALLHAMNREGWIGPIEPDLSIEAAILAIETEAARDALTAAAGRIKATALRHGINPQPFLDALSAEGEQ